jgi:hypothetical protein
MSRGISTVVLTFVIWPGINKSNHKAAAITTDSIWSTRRKTFASPTTGPTTRRLERIRCSTRREIKCTSPTRRRAASRISARTGSLWMEPCW